MSIQNAVRLWSWVTVIEKGETLRVFCDWSFKGLNQCTWFARTGNEINRLIIQFLGRRRWINRAVTSILIYNHNHCILSRSILNNFNSMQCFEHEFYSQEEYVFSTLFLNVKFACKLLTNLHHRIVEHFYNFLRFSGPSCPRSCFFSSNFFFSWLFSRFSVSHSRHTRT